METELVPAWIESLLSTEFFSVCRVHGDAPRSECNMYCLDCNAGAFCFYCRSSKHKDHHVIQIRRSSYHDVVRVAEIQNAIDINEVQTYVINSARVLFLNERPQPKVGKAASHICDICGRSLLDPCRFCSLGCKLVGIKRKRDTSFILDTKNKEDVTQRNQEGKSRRMLRDDEEGADDEEEEEQEEEELREGTKFAIYKFTPPQPIINSTTTTTTAGNASARRRKGIPRRAPFGS